ncbi:hypothetical protein, partial [Burkholderia sola]|uniref:hypothetical protein n=1 Tax=Burkholderia sola TaxID=2843302 RepID=UPI003390730A
RFVADGVSTIAIRKNKSDWRQAAIVRCRVQVLKRMKSSSQSYMKISTKFSVIWRSERNISLSQAKIKYPMP